MRFKGAWLLWPAVGTLICSAYVIASSASFRAVLMSLTSLVSVMYAIVAIRRRRPADARLWYALIGGLAVWAVGDLVVAGNALTQTSAPFPSWSDAFYLGAYPLLVGALFGLSRPPGRRRLAGLIDAAVIATGLGLVYWVFVIGPMVHAPGESTLVRLTSAAYPTAGLLEIAVTMPLVFRIGGRSPALWLLTLSSVAVMLGNAGYMFLTPGGFGYTLALGVYSFGYVTLAGAVLYAPTARTGADYVAERFGRGRLALLGASTLPVPVVLIIQGLHSSASISWLAVATGSVVLFGLVLSRLSGFVAKVQVQAGQLESMAMQDELTGLPNRRRFEQRLRESLTGQSVQLAVLDLNGFKEVNDRLGHAAGDRLLAEVGHRLAGAVRQDDLVARMGGDEFAVLLRGATPAVMDRLVERLGATLRTPIELDGQMLLIGASVGSADNSGTDDPYEVLRRADIAMYAAKNSERHHRRYTPAMDEDAGEQTRLGAELRAALDTGQFRLFYQPIVSLPDGRIVSVEALVRWEHPERGFVSPVEFIPVAERNGLIVELGAWILRTACAQAVVWRDTLGDAAPQRMSVNVSARQLAEPDFPDLVTSVLAWTGLGASNLVVEVTETAVFGGGQAVRSVKDLHELGVRIALDDFGTGHSSLGLLQTVPVDILKVDKAFVDNITMAGRHAVIATALIQVSNGLGLMAVAEGVETAEQAAELHRLGYRLAQGYHFGRPVPQPDFQAAAVS